MVSTAIGAYLHREETLGGADLERHASVIALSFAPTRSNRGESNAPQAHRGEIRNEHTREG